LLLTNNKATQKNKVANRINFSIGFKIGFGFWLMIIDYCNINAQNVHNVVFQHLLIFVNISLIYNPFFINLLLKMNFYLMFCRYEG